MARSSSWAFSYNPKKATMNAKVSVFLVFAVFALVVFPVAIVFHFHLYADGSYFFARILESRTFDAAGHTPARVGHHFMTQLGLVAAMNCGVSNIRHLSWLYGISLFYLPWFAYFLTSWLFLRAAMPTHAILVALMYCLLLCSTSFFIISESHLAASLFVLTLAVLVTCDLTKRPVQASLLLLWLICLSCYEFWAFFFLACLGIVLTKRSVKPMTYTQAYPRVIFVILYVLGTGLNIYSIIFTPVSKNRNDMFTSHLTTVWLQLLAFAILFLLPILFVVSSLLVEGEDARLPVWLRRSVGRVDQAAGNPALLIVLGLVITGGGAAVMFFKLATPWSSYYLRILNLILPLLFVSFLSAFHKTSPPCTHPFMSHKVLISGLFVMLCITSHAWLFHTSGFLDFKKRVFKATQSNTGYVTVGDALLGFQRYEWSYTYPSMSLLLQAMQPTSIKSVVYVPGVFFQPFAPLDADHAHMFPSAVSVRVERDGLRTNQASEVTVRKLDEPQR
jgi:hypothetical protein